ncbi:hypothetical protein BDZ45DRAFT_676433 [Acephala macrosclerotiorum]|nr:hypothetical protein BDZ45DRAFT_676433 [Acephala macrosclerotiorum]
MVARLFSVLGLAVLPALVHSFASTDSWQDADPPQSGYLPNHNIDPTAVASNLTIAWSKTYNTNEVFYAKPLVYTPPGAPNEYVITVSNQNIVRVIDGFTGNIVNTRTLDAPFASTDTQCGDIPNTVGITGTPIIDTATDIMYFFSKGYKNGQAGPQGTILGQYKFYAVKLPGLTDVSGFPVIIDGHNANNDPTRYFIGGTVLNRPGLAMFGNTIVGGFGGHCDNFNYTGMLVSVSKTGGVGVTNIQAMEASPGAPSPQTLDITVQGGGKAGIWQSGMGLAADTSANRVFFVTGNARGAGANGGANGKAASGKVYLSTLEQCVVNMAVDPSAGTLTQADYFEPYAYDSLNGGDRDFGSAGVGLLDPTVFNGNGVSRIAVAGGKDGNVYIMNADNLGGFAGGTAGSNNVIQTITNANSYFSGPGSYPLEGGYLYLAPTGDSMYAYSFSNQGGVPQFTFAGKTALTFAGKSVPTITTNNGAPGTGIVWLADVNKGLLAYNAVPVNGVLTPITLPTGAATGGLTKNQRPAFGDGRIYTTKANVLFSLSGGGQKSKVPLTCTPNPASLGSVMVHSTSTVQVTCTANVAITAPKCDITSTIFNCGSAALPASVASGAQFSFPVVFNLSDAALLAYENASAAPLAPGSQAGTLNVRATAPSGYLQNTIVPLSGTAVASGGYLVINQTTMNFGGVFIGGAQPSQSSRSIILTNKGSQSLTFNGLAWQDYYATGQPYQNITSSTVGNGFTSSNFPAIGSTLAAGASLTIPLVFLPNSTGIAASTISFWSDGGFTDLLMQGTAAQGSASSSSSPSTTKATSSSTSSSSVSTSTITPILSSSSSSSSILSSTSTTVTSSSIITTAITPSGTLNPLEPKTISTFQYIGCYTDLVNNVRTLSSIKYVNSTMTLEMCATKCTSYDYFGVEYGSECYCGYTLNATLRATETDCNKPCGGNATEICGKANRLSTYQNTIYYPPPAAPVHVQTSAGFVWQGCYTEATAGRALTGATFTSTTMTVEACIASCAGYTYAGIEYAGQCYCGNTLGAGSALTATTDCSMLCSGSVSEYCGAGSRLDLYMYNPAAASSLSSSSAAPSSTSSKISTSPSIALTSTSSPITLTSSSAVPTSFTTSTISSSRASSSTSSSALPYVTPPAPKTRSFTWSIGWVNAAPDGYTRPFIGINGVWPCPALSVNMGDTIKLTVTNNLVNESSAIHFHGIFQKNTTFADGPAMVTQCPIQPGASFVYEFKVTQPGTYWYHAHIGGQYIDGFRGPLVVNDVNAPYRVDTEYVMTLTDLYHAQAPGLINYYQSQDNANNNNGAEPVPNSILINEAQNVKFSITPGKKYLFRIINMGAFAPQYLQFDQHDITVVEIDGVYTQPYTVSQLFITVAQRYSVILTAKTTSTQNFAIKASMYTDMFNPQVIPAAFNTEVSAFLVYNAALAMPAPLSLTPQPFDDSVFVPYDQMPLLDPPTLPIYMTVSFGTNGNGQYRGYINGIDYVPQKVPTLYTAMYGPAADINNAAIYGQQSNPIVLPYGAVVELTLSNHDSFAHPFHLHGHNFQVVGRDPGGANFPINIPSGPPMRRDTVLMMADGSVTIRFVADNPGVTLFHCHIEWHVEAGLTATFIEAPTELQALDLYVPVSHRSACAAQGIAMKGNAAGNTKDYTDLTGANSVANTNPWGSLVSPPTTPAPPYSQQGL